MRNPIFSVIVLTFLGLVAVAFAQPLLPYALAFAAGAMIFVVAEELIPEPQKGGHIDLATIPLMVGFAAMMTLDVTFGERSLSTKQPASQKSNRLSGQASEGP